MLIALYMSLPSQIAAHQNAVRSVCWYCVWDPSCFSLGEGRWCATMGGWFLLL